LTYQRHSADLMLRTCSCLFGRICRFFTKMS